MIEAKRWHVNQDEQGFWFLVEEDVNGDLHLFTHAADQEHAIHDAEQTNKEMGWDAPILVEAEQRPFPEGGIAPDASPPLPRTSAKGSRTLPSDT